MEPLWSRRVRLSRNLILPGLLLVLTEGGAYLVIGLDAASRTISLAVLAVVLQQVSHVQSLGFLGDDAYLLHAGAVARSADSSRSTRRTGARRSWPCRGGRCRRSLPPGSTSCSRACRSPYRGRPAGARGPQLAHRRRRERRPRWHQRRREDDARQAAVPPVRADAGRILAGGVDIRELDLAVWRRHIAVVFQDFVHYPFSARENVTIGTLDQGKAVGDADLAQ